MFNCTVSGCTQTFSSIKGVRTHIVRKHNSDEQFLSALQGISSNVKQEMQVCKFCDRCCANKYTLEKHWLVCKSKAQFDAQEVSLKEVESSVSEMHKQYIENMNTLTTLVHDVQAKVADIKPTVNIVQNNSRSYTQNNTLIATRESIDSLIPITNESLNHMVHSTFKSALDDHLIFTNVDDIARYWVERKLKDSIVVTDQSRGIAHWKDGDQNNKHIRDPKCDALSNKLQQAIQPGSLTEYSSYILDQTNKNQTDASATLPLLNATVLISSLQTKTANDLGANMIKYVKNGATKTLIDDSQRLGVLRKHIQTVYSAYIIPIVCSSAQVICSLWINKIISTTVAPVQRAPAMLEMLGNTSMIVTDTVTPVRLVTLKVDDHLNQTKEIMFHLRTDDQKGILKYKAEQFFDFIKTSIVSMFDIPNQHVLLCAFYNKQNANLVHLLDTTEQQIHQNFNKFTEWLTYDRYKERTYEHEIHQKTRICEYEKEMLNTIVCSYA
jgi:hypothetical protein